MGRECCCTELAPKLRAATAESARWRKVMEGLVEAAEDVLPPHPDGYIPGPGVYRTNALRAAVRAARAELEKG